MAPGGSGLTNSGVAVAQRYGGGTGFARHAISIEEAISAVSTVLEENSTLRTDQVGPTRGVSAFAANVTDGVTKHFRKWSFVVSNLSVDGKELHREVDRSYWMHLVLHARRYGLNISRAKDDVGRGLRRRRDA